MLGEKGLDIGGSVQVTEGFVEHLLEQRDERWRILRVGIARNHHANPAGRGQPCACIASTLNNSPISPLPARRCTALAKSDDRSGLEAVKAAARAPIPRRFSHSPCVTSAVTVAPAS